MAQQERIHLQCRPLGWEDPLEEEMTTHCSILAWRIQWTEEPGGLLSMRSQRDRHKWIRPLTASLFSAPATPGPSLPSFFRTCCSLCLDFPLLKPGSHFQPSIKGHFLQQSFLMVSHVPPLILPKSSGWYHTTHAPSCLPYETTGSWRAE